LPRPAVARVAPRRWFPTWVAAAAVLLAVGIGSWLLLGGQREGSTDLAQAPGVPTDSPSKAPAEVIAENEPVMGPEVPHRPGSHSVFASPTRQATELHAAKARMPLIQLVRELEPPALLEQLQARARDHACRIDLYCTQPGKALEQMGLAFAAQ